jgi:hypothetical protein
MDMGIRIMSPCGMLPEELLGGTLQAHSFLQRGLGSLLQGLALPGGALQRVLHEIVRDFEMDRRLAHDRNLSLMIRMWHPPKFYGHADRLLRAEGPAIYQPRP